MERQTYTLKAGNINRLDIRTEELPDPETGQVLVEVKAIGLNFADVFAVLGLYSATPEGTFIPGLEFAGVVLKTGSGVNHLKQGDRVMGCTRFGAYATHVKISSEYLIPLPDQWSFDEGASYLVQVLTAYYGLVTLGNLSSDQTVLIHSAAGGVGIWANRIAKAKNCYTIGTVGHASKCTLTRQEGVDKTIIREKKTFDSELKKALGSRPLNIIMECIGGTILKVGWKNLAPMGRMIVYGSAHYGKREDRPFYPRLMWKYIFRPRIDVQKMIKENKSLMAFNLIYLFEHTALMQHTLGQIESLNLGKPIIGHRFSFEQLPEALKMFQSGSTTGKVVIQLK